MSNTERGYVYILRDRVNNNEIKVGLSKDPISRIKQLHNTSTALPMYLYYVWEGLCCTNLSIKAYSTI